MSKGVLVCCDRDGTINVDKNYYLGSQDNWRELVDFMPGVIEGTKRLNQYGIFPTIITQQSGIALRKLSLERAEEVNEYIRARAEMMGAYFLGAFICPFIDRENFERQRKKASQEGRELAVDENFFRESHEDIKPGIGLIKRAALVTGKRLTDLDIYVIGDRFSDIMCGLNAEGYGILVASPKTKELRDLEKIDPLDGELKKRIYVAKDLSEASKFVLHRVS